MHRLEPKRVETHVPQPVEIPTRVVGETLQRAATREGRIRRVDIEHIDLVDLHVSRDFRSHGDAVIPATGGRIPLPSRISGSAETRGKPVCPGLRRIHRERVVAIRSGHRNSLEIPARRIAPGNIADRFFLGRRRRNDSVVDRIPVGIIVGTLAIVEVRPDLGLDGVERACRKRNRHRHGFGCLLIDEKFRCRVVRTESSRGCRSHGHGQGRSADCNGERAGLGGRQSGSRHRRTIAIVNEGRADAIVESGREVILHQGTRGGWHRDASLPNLNMIASARFLIIMKSNGNLLPATAVDAVKHQTTGLIATPTLPVALVKGRAHRGARIQWIPHGRGVGPSTSFGRNMPNICQLLPQCRHRKAGKKHRKATPTGKFGSTGEGKNSGDRRGHVQSSICGKYGKGLP